MEALTQVLLYHPLAKSLWLTGLTLELISPELVGLMD